MRELPLACSLSGGDLRERGERWRALAARALTEGRRADGAVRLEFARADGVEAELRELVRLEGECCAFLDMDLEPAGDAVTLVVAGPPDAAPIVDGFLALARR